MDEGPFAEDALPHRKGVELDHKTIAEKQFVQRYLQDQLSPEEFAAFEEHCLSCLDCLGRLELAEGFNRFLRGELPVEESHRFVRPLLAAIRDDEARPPSQSDRVEKRRPTLAASPGRKYRRAPGEQNNPQSLGGTMLPVRQKQDLEFATRAVASNSLSARGTTIPVQRQQGLELATNACPTLPAYELDRFLLEKPSAEERRRVVRHLLSGCPSCNRFIRHLLAGSRSCKEDAQGREYDRAFKEPSDLLIKSAAASALERERAPELAVRLLALPEAERYAAVRTNRSYQDWALCVWLIDEHRQQIYVAPWAALKLAKLAVTIAEELDARHLGTSLVNDLRARAWAAVGQVLHTLSDLRGADEAFLRAENLLVDGTGDALEEAQVLELKAALRRDQRLFSEAHSLIDKASSLSKQCRDFHLVGRAFVQKGRICGAENDLKGAVEWLRKGAALLDPVRDQRFGLAARYSLMFSLHESGRHQEAWSLLKISRPEFEEHGGEFLNLRLRWFEGKIQRALGRLREAEAALLEARSGLIQQEIGIDAALVSLDLADLYASQARGDQLRALVVETLPIFRSHNLHAEAMAALQAVRIDTVNSLLQEIAAYLQRARNDPGFRFSPFHPKL